jgi:hypothetical protein
MASEVEKTDVEEVGKAMDEKSYKEVMETAKPRVAEAVMRLREKQPPLRGNGLFKHPPDWTEDEMNYIIDCLKANVPIHVIAKFVHCESHMLSRLISNTPELRRLKEEQRANMLANAVFQADKLVQQGNGPMIMYIIDKLGGLEWNGGGEGSGGGGGGDRIVMGVIPDEEVKKAEESVKEIQEKNGGAVITDPMAMAMMQETVKEEVAKAVEAAKPEAIEADAVSQPPYAQNGGESVVDVMNQASFDQYGSVMGGGFNQQTDDPWASGSDSPFFQ